jgi:hypothetical protein
MITFTAGCITIPMPRFELVNGPPAMRSLQKAGRASTTSLLLFLLLLMSPSTEGRCESLDILPLIIKLSTTFSFAGLAVGRFQVMAVLQAARAYALGLPVESAYSWGLARAIFFAAAKRGFKGSGGGKGNLGRGAGAAVGATHKPSPAEGGGERKETAFHLGDELAFKVASSTAQAPTFVIGGEPQTAADFARQIKGRFQGSSFLKAWKEALEYVEAFPEETLKSQSRFFSDVYRPRRDEFAKEWSELSTEEGRRAAAPAAATTTTNADGPVVRVAKARSSTGRRRRK